MTRSRLALAAVLLLALVQVPQVEVTAAAQSLGGRRSVVPQSAALALGGPVARRTRRGRGRRSGQQVHLLPGHDRRRRVEDRGRRAQLGQRVRRLLQGRLGRRHCRGAVQPERRLRRHGRGLHPRQRVLRRRRLQVDRRRQDLDAPGLETTKQIGRLQVHPTNPDIAFVAALGDAVGPESRPRRLPDARRRHAPGRRCSSRARTPARSTWCSIRPTRTCSTPPRWNCGAIRGASAAPGPAPRSSSPPTAATRGPTSAPRPACRRATRAASASRWRRRSPTACGRSSTPPAPTRASTAPTTAARPGPTSPTTPTSRSGRGTTTTSSPTPRTPTCCGRST